MKKVILSIFLILFCTGSVWSLDFEETKKLAELGDSKSQYFLGLMYNAGEGVPQDYNKSVYWYAKSAEQGDSKEQYNLGIKYSNGKGVPQDYKKAVFWYTKSAEQGNSSAQYNLGIMYFDGKGVPQNYKIAYVWESLAAAQGQKDAIKNRDIYIKELTPQQLNEAQELASKIQYKIDNLTK